MKKSIFIIAASLLLSCELTDLTETVQKNQEYLRNSRAPVIDVFLNDTSVIGLAEPVDFGEVDSGFAIEFTVVNTGNATLVLVGVSLTDNTVFEIAGPASNSIEPGQNVTFSVTISGSNGYYSDTITIFSNADNSPVEIDISGTVKAPQIG